LEGALVNLRELAFFSALTSSFPLMMRSFSGSCLDFTSTVALFFLDSSFELEDFDFEDGLTSWDLEELLLSESDEEESLFKSFFDEEAFEELSSEEDAEDEEEDSFGIPTTCSYLL